MIDYAVVNPATGETVARYDSFTDAQVEHTLGTAEAGFETWRAPGGRAGLMTRRAAELHRERREEPGRHHRPGDGQGVAAALAEAAFAADITEYYADQAEVIPSISH